jgi:hypothetical protein
VVRLWLFVDTLKLTLGNRLPKDIVLLFFILILFRQKLVKPLFATKHNLFIYQYRFVLIDGRLGFKSFTVNRF